MVEELYAGTVAFLALGNRLVHGGDLGPDGVDDLFYRHAFG